MTKTYLDSHIGKNVFANFCKMGFNLACLSNFVTKESQSFQVRRKGEFSILIIFPGVTMVGKGDSEDSLVQ